LSKDVLEKVRRELGFLVVALSISLGISAAMVLDAARVFGVLREIRPFLAVVRISEFVIGLFWLFLTLKIFRECMRMGRKHPGIFFVRRGEAKDVSMLLRDLIAFYRGYYQEVRFILMLTFLIGLSMIASAVYLISSNLIPPEEFFFHLSIGTATSAFSLSAFLFVEKKWGKKLLKVKSEEKIFKEFLGEAC